HGAFPVRLVRARAGASGRLPLLGALLHRGSFLVRESLGRLGDRGGALGGLLRVLRVGEFARSFLLRHQRLLSGSLPPPTAQAHLPPPALRRGSGAAPHMLPCLRCRSDGRRPEQPHAASEALTSGTRWRTGRRRLRPRTLSRGRRLAATPHP